MSALAIIPCRGGQQSIPRKNIHPVGGKPLLAWTIEVAKESNQFSRIIASTEDTEIRDVAALWGAEAPFLRPKELSKPDTLGMDPILHALHWLGENENYLPEIVVVLQPTSPLRNAEDIEKAIKLMLETEAESVLSVTKSHSHPQWMKTMDKKGRISNYLSSQEMASRRQDLPPVYSLNGAIYISTPTLLFANQQWQMANTYGYLMPEERSLDIDTAWDMYLADLVLSDPGMEIAG